MSQSDTVQRYFDAWNAHDTDAIVAAFADGGTYEDPTTGGRLTGPDIGANAAALWLRSRTSRSSSRATSTTEETCSRRNGP